MNMKSPMLALAVALALTAPTFAAGYIPLGPKVYTPQPDLVISNPDIITPQAPTITQSGGGFEPNPRSEPHQQIAPRAYGDLSADGKGRYWNEKCQTIAEVNDDCTVATMQPGSSTGAAIPVVVTSTANPDLVTPQPDTVIPQPDTCKQRGLGSHGLGYYDC